MLSLNEELVTLGRRTNLLWSLEIMYHITALFKVKGKDKCLNNVSVFSIICFMFSHFSSRVHLHW